MDITVKVVSSFYPHRPRITRNYPVCGRGKTYGFSPLPPKHQSMGSIGKLAALPETSRGEQRCNRLTRLVVSSFRAFALMSGELESTVRGTG